MLEWALRYAKAGYAVLPVKPKGKIPLCEHGSKDATTDESVIRKWWSKWPDANIGITLADLVVIDIDPRNGGDADMIGHKLPDTCYARTGGHGWHYAYHVSNGAKCLSTLGPGIDVKNGAGAYIVVEPSIHPSGEKYVWLDETELWSMRPAEAPEWLFAQKDEAPPPDKTRRGSAEDWLDSVRAGNALHDSTRDLAAHFIGIGLSFSETCKLLEIAMHASMAPRDERWRERMQNIPHQVNTAIQKFRKGEIEALFFEAAQFIADITPPQWLVDGIIQRSYLYGLTALTNHGKTALAAYLAVCVATGRDFSNQQCEPGHVLFLAGENPDDFKIRLRATVQAMGITQGEFSNKMHIMPVAGKLIEFIPKILELSEITALSLIIIDTSVAYFSYTEENSNSENGLHAQDMRSLIKCNGRPAIAALCHPVKNATQDNMIPRGGGAFLNELDCNLTLWKEGDTSFTMSHNKLRGPQFEPMQFQLSKVVVVGVKDSKDREVSTMIALPITESAAATAREQEYSDADLALKAISHLSKPSLGGIAEFCGWKVGNDKPARAKAQRIVKLLVAEKCVEKDFGKLTLTPKGKKRLYS